MYRRTRQKLVKSAIALIATLLFLTPIYLMVHQHADMTSSEGTEYQSNYAEVKETPKDTTKPCAYIEPAPADGGTLSDEKKRFNRHLNEIQSRCEHIQLLGNSNQKRTKESQDLKATSYICLGGKMGLQRQNCLIYSFGIKHPWIQFSELVERELGCNVYVFEPAVDFIDHYHSKNIRFFNARLSNIDQQAQYSVPGEKGWKYNKFFTILKEKHFTKKPIDVVRLDVTLDLWNGMSTMLSDGSLLFFVKELIMEYDIAKKNITEVRQMFGMAQWLKRQGFQLVHSQATKTSGASYAVTYINSKIASSSKSVPLGDKPVVTTTKKEIPKAKKEIPKTKKEIPKAKMEISKTKKEIPKTKKEIPKTKKEIPIPKTKKEIPKTTKRPPLNHATKRKVIFG